MSKIQSEVGVPTFRASVTYEDPRAAIAFLQAAFGFELAMLVEGDDGRVAHCQMAFGDGQVLVSREWNERQKSPRRVAGINTQSVSVQLSEGLDEHYERALAAGALIDLAPQDQWYGDRCYICRDPEGHIWSFSQTLRDLTEADARAAKATIRRSP